MAQHSLEPTSSLGLTPDVAVAVKNQGVQSAGSPHEINKNKETIMHIESVMLLLLSTVIVIGYTSRVNADRALGNLKEST